ncbi:nitroreductase [Pseudovibrio exalbescens]|uniref:nitroreductase family protein n=1 Tax=Pseudovibrio exalbescens TaxID=197461 RepID=UPI0023658566|nr:nitroreductase [Pseudovibrio exalbescens]MDD7910120.1 nitroreductase [Pseudovibrio exalbescens]
MSRTAVTPENLIELLESRVSASLKAMDGSGPSDEEVEQLIAAAATAPDHGRLTPYRFMKVSMEGRRRLGDLFEAAQKERNLHASPETLERARQKAYRGPCLLVLIGCIRSELETGIPEDEQLVTAGAALQNLLVAATAMGYASRVTSGRGARSPLFHKGLGLQENERFLCFVSLGHVALPRTAKGRPEPSSLLSEF